MRARALLCCAALLGAAGCGGASEPNASAVREALHALLLETTRRDWRDTKWLRDMDARIRAEAEAAGKPVSEERLQIPIEIRMAAFELLSVERVPKEEAPDEELWLADAAFDAHVLGLDSMPADGLMRLLGSVGLLPNYENKYIAYRAEGAYRLTLRRAPGAGEDADRWEIVAFDGKKPLQGVAADSEIDDP